MKAVVFDEELKLVDNYEKPVPKEGEALVRVNLAGICNTDYEITKGYMGYCGVLGHEAVGIVEEVNDVDKSLVGKRVVPEISYGCKEPDCPWCAQKLYRHCPNRHTLGIFHKDGVFAGSAVFENDLLNVFYTGYSEKKVNDKTEKTETPCLATSKDGWYFGKSANNPVIKGPPGYLDIEFFTNEFFRDPYVWKNNDKYYALIGTRYEKTKDGAVLLFQSDDMRNWEFVNITAIGSKGEMGSTWDCPNFLHIGENDLLIINPTGIKPQGKMFLNKYVSGAFIGKLDFNTGKFKQKGPFALLDYGFDFYAPQTVKTPDGRIVIIGWLGMPDSVLHEASENWSGLMTLPRELKIVDNKLVVQPLEELKQLRGEHIAHSAVKINGHKEFSNIKGDAYEIETTVDLTNATSFSIKLRESKIQETVLTYDKATQTLTLNRDKSGHALKGEREVKLPVENNLLKLRIFIDRSSVEVFANNIAMTARIYPDKASAGIKFVAEGTAIIKNLDFYSLKSVYD